jgi:hypothetical protein
MSVPPGRGDSPGHLTVNDQEERVGLSDVLHTLAYSFVDKDRLFLRPTVRGRGVNVSIEEVIGSRGGRVLLLALTQRCATSTFTISRGPSLAWYYSYSLLPHHYSITHLLSRVGRARTSTTSGDVLLANLQKKPTSPAHKDRSSSSVGSRSVSFVLIMATLSTRKHLSVGTYPPLSPTCVRGTDKRKIIRRN